MNNEGNRKLALTLIALGIIISFFGGSLAYWNWESSEEQKTLVSVQVQGATLTIQGENIEHTGMYPTNDCDGPGALIGEVATATAVNGTNSDMEVILKIRATLSVKQGSLTVDNKDKIKWALVDTSDGTTCETTQYKGTLRTVSTNTDIDTGIRFIATKNATTSKSYRLYVWLDSTYTHTNVGDVVSDPMQDLGISVKYSPASELSQEKGNAHPNAPVLDDGMIPIKISADGIATTVSQTDGTWYNYSNREWANVVLVKNSGTQTRDYYKSNTGVTVAEDDILAYYVWIPRYKYKIWTLTESSAGQEQTIDIVFEETSAQVTQGNVVGDYITHPAFIWDGTPIAGIWVGKFETGHSSLASSTTSNNLNCTDENCTNADGLIIKPNVQSLRNNNISNQFYASRSMTRSSNPFGLSLSTTDSHMMKNSEWGAVAYLSHSQYGINQEIYINNSSGYYTGRSGGNVGGSVNTLATQFPDNSTSINQYNSYGYYTWTGQTISSSGTIGSYASDRTLGTNASTTGNVTGVYDMSGGAYEYVMGWYSGANSNYATDTSYFGWTSSANKAGFTAELRSKYWDNYTTTSNTTACNGGVCFGHALSETNYWYGDYRYFVHATIPWFRRGGYYSLGASAGAWYFYRGDGSASSSHSFRSVAIVGA